MSVEWFDDAVVYQIFIDRFAGFEDTDNWHNPEFVGGDLQGIIDKLDYIEDLGIDVIWISPFYETSAYHGYHITDFYSVDERFGTEEDLKELIEEIHERDMKIVADFVPNHVSHEHPFFKNAQSNPASDYGDWFYFDDWPNDYKCFLDFDELPKLNLENPQASKHVIEAAKHWLDMGLDGYRLDHVVGPSNSFWSHFQASIKSEYPDAVLFGEAWWNGVDREHLDTFNIPNPILQWLTRSQERIQRNYVGLMDGVLDFKASNLIKKAVKSEYFSPLYRVLLNLHYRLYPGNFALLNFLDNHDMNRALYQFDQDKELLKDAFSIMRQQSQPTVVYYGTEIGMTQHQGISEFEKHGDLQPRKPMQWDNQDEELLEFFRKEIRKKRF